MKPRVPPLLAIGLFASVALTGCASRSGGADPLGYATASCPDLNVMIGDTSKEISAVAVSRGKIDRLNIPPWLPGGEKAVSALKDKRTRRIDRLDGQLQAMRTARQDRCL